MKLRGADDLVRRLDAAVRSTSRYSPRWADEYVRVARSMVPVDTGALRASLRSAGANEHGARISANRTAFFVDAGTRAHTIEPRRASTLAFNPGGGRTVFARRVDHPATRARPFRRRAGEEALRREPLDETVIDAWNGAA